MRKNIGIIFMCVLFALPAYADKDEKIQELIRIMNLSEQEVYLDAQIVTPIACSFDLSATEETSVRNSIIEALDYTNQVTEMVKPFWEENFSEQELEDLLNFYRTGVGKKTLDLMPQMTQYVAEKVAEYQEGLRPKITKIVSDLMVEHSRRSDVEREFCIRKKFGQ